MANTTFPTDLGTLPWPNFNPPRNGDAADELTMRRALNAAAQRTDTLKTFLVGVEQRLLTRFFAPLEETTQYSAAELSRMAAQAAALPAAMQQVSDSVQAVSVAHDEVNARLDSLSLPPWMVIANDPAFVEIAAISADAWLEGAVTLPNTGITVPTLDLLVDAP